ncbi:hypothetical protein [Galactobacter caseinivorans]|uniref:ATP synthase protein I n=1 Tax=Galactobacter caseinivorans TaxID=2676123 RepID=A0A496PMU2_9MICC|nr:hypothetical protein [Galactobacter caseinivorans]RKW71852.1 hypothetical protein DWQ67_03215 [Galactobacter caseinivorans]
MSKPTPTPYGVAVASDEDKTPWMSILLWCMGLTGAAIVVTALLGLLVAQRPGLLSVLAVGVVVVVFFGLSLLVGHLVGQRAPNAQLAAFMLMYIVKVIGFGAFLLVPHDPFWFNGTWVTIGAVVSVLVWQGVEMYRFSRVRMRIFSETEAGK